MSEDQETLLRLQIVLQSPLLTEAFHRVNSLIPDEQQLVTITPETLVSDAFMIMNERNFSQLPVVQGHRVLGVFSYRSFAKESIKLNKGKEQLLVLSVDELMDLRPIYGHVHEDMGRILEKLEGNDAVLIGNPDHLQGIITPSDVLKHLYAFATPFVLISEIEMSLRKLISYCVKADELADLARSSLTNYDPAKVPTKLEDMTFDDYVGIIRRTDNWPKFQTVFGTGPIKREFTRTKLETVRNLRNDVFHFKRTLTVEDLQTLTQHRDWMLTIATRVEEANKQKDGDAE